VNSSEHYEMWASQDAETERCKLGFQSKEAALADLRGKSGEVLRYQRGIPTDGLDSMFDVDHLTEGLNGFLETSDVIGDHELGFIDITKDERDLLVRRLVGAVVAWAREVDLPIWEIIERHEI